MNSSLYETRLQGIMVVLFIKTTTQSKMANTRSMILYSRILQRKLGTRFGVNFVVEYLSSRIIIGFDLKHEFTLLLSVRVAVALPPFSLIRDFGKQNTRGNASKISVSLTCYRHMGSKSTNHSPLA